MLLVSSFLHQKKLCASASLREVVNSKPRAEGGAIVLATGLEAPATVGKICIIACKN
jgi:hypothetical protein